MLEFLICSLVTILPDYLIRRYSQGKRWNHEITFFTMWYELRIGITACLLLTVGLITLIFYYHPSTTNASPFFRTITIVPEAKGRVEEVFVSNNQIVKAGQPLFSLIDSSQDAAVDLVRLKIAEADAAFLVAEADLAASKGVVEQAESTLDQARNELRMKQELQNKNADLISDREIERNRNVVESREGTLAAAIAKQQAVEARLTTVLPSQRESAVQELEQAQVEQNKTVITAGTSGRLQQFMLQPGDLVNPFLRPAGLLIPTETVESGLEAVQAGFSQLSAAVIHPGMLAEITCLSKPFVVIPMVVTGVQDVIAAGQIRPTDLLLDIQDRARPGTLGVVMEPLYPNGLDGVIPGTKCIANAYTSNHDLIASGELGFFKTLFLHMVDTVGIVHAIILRIQTLMLPVKMLVFGGH